MIRTLGGVNESGPALAKRPSKKSRISSNLNCRVNQDKVTLRRKELRANVEYETASVLSRRGSILSRGKILKADHFPSCRNTKLPVQLESAPNIRQIQGRRVYGVGQPTAAGMRSVLDHVQESSTVWINMREEPFIFINGHPYCVKDWKRPFDNIERTGITADQVQADEKQLQMEILKESRRYGGKILLHGETVPEGDTSVAAMGEVYCYWEDIDEYSIVCYHELCHELQDSSVAFYRIPVTDEHALQEKDFDAIHAILATVPAEAAVIFNCQMGRGRATTGTVVATMLWGLLGQPQPQVAVSSQTGMCFSAVVELAGLIDVDGVNGPECITAVDACVETCAAMQNIRDAVVVRRDKAAKYAARGIVSKEAKELGVARHYLERYLLLVLYQAYLTSRTAEGYGAQRFTDWMEAHPNRAAIYVLIDQMSLEDDCSSYDSETSTVSSTDISLASLTQESE